MVLLFYALLIHEIVSLQEFLIQGRFFVTTLNLLGLTGKHSKKEGNCVGYLKVYYLKLQELKEHGKDKHRYLLIICDLILFHIIDIRKMAHLEGNFAYACFTRFCQVCSFRTLKWNRWSRSCSPLPIFKAWGFRFSIT